MPTLLAIEFQLDQFAQLIKQANNAAAAFNNLNNAATAFKAGRPSGGASRGVGSGNSPGSSSPAPGSKAWYNWQPAIPKMPKMPKAPPTFGQKLSNLLGTSRVGFSGGQLQFLPLLNRIMTILPAPVLAIASAATAVAGSLYMVAQTAAEVTSKLTAIVFATGSRGGAAGTLSALGNGIGVNMGDVSSSFQERITSDGLARAFAAQMGIMAVQRPFGEVDEGKNLVRAIEELRKMSFENRVRAARTVGLESILPLTNLSNEEYNKRKQQGAAREKIFGGEKTASAVEDFKQALAGLGESVQNLLGAIGIPILHSLTNVFKDLADFLNDTALLISKFQDTVKNLIFNSTGILGIILRLADNQSSSGSQSTSTPMDRNTEALNQNTQAINAMVPGTFGRGERLSRAFPGAMEGNPDAFWRNPPGTFRLGNL